LIDTNDVSVVKGNDNRGTPQAGTLASTLLTLDANGTAETQLTLPMQPGDNLRVAGLFETNNAQTHLNLLQVTNANAPYYVTNSNDQVKNFVGTVSPMLTVWRRLHIEVDSMEAVTNSGSEANFLNGVVLQYSDSGSPSGQSTLVTRAPFTLTTYHQFQRGIVDIVGVGRYRILGNTSLAIPGSTDSIYSLLIDGRPGTNAIGATAKIYDDDDQYLQSDSLYPSVLNLPAPLPYDGMAAGVVTNIAKRYGDAYILPVNGNALGWNTTVRIPFRRIVDSDNESMLNNGNLQFIGKDRPDFWAFSIVFAYQFVEHEDGDPDREGFIEGVTEKSLSLFNWLGAKGWSVIYLEANRERTFSIFLNNPEAFTGTLTAPVIRANYTNAVFGTVAHELGHAPGKHLGATDHKEGNLMKPEGAQINENVFSPSTILRFRKTNKWTGE